MNLDSPEMIGLAAQVLLIPYLVGHLKPMLRAIPGVDRMSPWQVLADLLGIAGVYLLWTAGLAPEWIDSWAAALLTGIVLGVTSSMARDGALTAEVVLMAARDQGAKDVR